MLISEFLPQDHQISTSFFLILFFCRQEKNPLGKEATIYHALQHCSTSKVPLLDRYLNSHWEVLLNYLIVKVEVELTVNFHFIIIHLHLHLRHHPIKSVATELHFQVVVVVAQMIDSSENSWNFSYF